jgi:hypothetical protein
MIGPTDLFHPSPAPHFKTDLKTQIFIHHSRNGTAKICKLSVGLISSVYSMKYEIFTSWNSYVLFLGALDLTVSVTG